MYLQNSVLRPGQYANTLSVNKSDDQDLYVFPSVCFLKIVSTYSYEYLKELYNLIESKLNHITNNPNMIKHNKKVEYHPVTLQKKQDIRPNVTYLKARPEKGRLPTLEISLYQLRPCAKNLSWFLIHRNCSLLYNSLHLHQLII